MRGEVGRKESFDYKPQRVQATSQFYLGVTRMGVFA